MGSAVSRALGGLALALAVRTVLAPAGWLLRIGGRIMAGFLCLWCLNTVSGFTGLCLPVNPVTVALAGFGGLPGLGLTVLLELMP